MTPGSMEFGETREISKDVLPYILLSRVTIISRGYLALDLRDVGLQLVITVLIFLFKIPIAGMFICQ